MLRKLIAVGALMLAAMCLTVPAAYADVRVVTDPVATVVAAPVLDFAQVNAIETLAMVASTDAADKAAGTCPSPQGAAESAHALRPLPPCTSRHYDPGWRDS